jgi:hypothetical protein
MKPHTKALRPAPASRSGCNRRASWPPSLSLSRYSRSYLIKSFLFWNASDNHHFFTPFCIAESALFF